MRLAWVPLTASEPRLLVPTLRRCCIAVILPVFAVLIAGCGMSANHGWRDAVDAHVGKLGYRNWIVIAESSFPAYNHPGTRQVNTHQPADVVLDQVLRSLESTEHLRPRIYLPREMNAVENDFAPGIDQYRSDLSHALHSYETLQLEQESIVTLMNHAQHNYDVLVLRTSTALPYTSVFLDLQPGYWDGESESRMRKKLRSP